MLFWVLDDVGYGQLSTLWRAGRDACTRQPGCQWTALHQYAHHRLVLAIARLHYHRAQSPFDWACMITEFSTGYPGYNGILPFDRGMLSEMLLPKGYNTFCRRQVAPEPPNTRPQRDLMTAGRLGVVSSAITAFWEAKPISGIQELVYDNHTSSHPSAPEEGYHLSIDLADKAIEFIQDAHVNAPDKPFFLYYATDAGHAPHHVPKECADKYKGKFDMGWDKYREIVHKRQLEMGIVSPDTDLSANDPDVPVWDTLPVPAKQLFARMMEVYAGFVSFTDYHFGRIFEFLREIGAPDNTLILVISDNGASSEGGPVGSFNEMCFFNNWRSKSKTTLRYR